MKLPLGLFAEETLPNCQYKNEQLWKNVWITSIETYTGETEIRNDHLYLCPDAISVNTKQDLTMLIHEHMIPQMTDNVNWCAIPNSEDLLIVSGRLNRLMAEFQNWENSLYRACSYQCGVEELLHTAQTLTENTLYLADMSFKILAFSTQNIVMEMSATWRYQMKHGYLPAHVMHGMINSGEFEKLNGYRLAATTHSEHFYVPFATRNIYHNNRPQAHLFIINIIKRPCFRDLAIAENLGSFLESHYFLMEKFALNHQHNNYESFFRDVIDGTIMDDVLIRHQLSQLDWELNDTYLLAVVNTVSRDDGFRRILMYHMESEVNMTCLVYRNYVVMIRKLEAGESTDSLKKQLNRYCSMFNISICVGKPFSPFPSIRKHLPLLLTALTSAEASRMENSVYSEEDFALSILLDRIRQNEELSLLLSSKADILSRYDEQHDSDFYATYLAYLRNERNVVKTSGELHIHRNTLMYRLEKIHELLQVDDNDFSFRLWMLLTMMIR